MKQDVKILETRIKELENALKIAMDVVDILGDFINDHDMCDHELENQVNPLIDQVNQIFPQENPYCKKNQQGNGGDFIKQAKLAIAKKARKQK